MKKYMLLATIVGILASILYLKMPLTVVQSTTENITKIEIYGDTKKVITNVVDIETILHEFHKTKYVRYKVIRNGEGTRQQYLVKLWRGQQLIQWINIADSSHIDVKQWQYYAQAPLDLTVFQ
ncbi:hypothetical protein GCM10007425_23040 [Lysinibacillus alkalisoli]|uniref:DUF3139 domain-containing protein n=1 Tax=Lysinibacillus alkalisoli TaxID=1911548 RepID=A0A917G8F4_9BACI|nr:hypothetical protein [Lysinibacillus alkalisoli]GGG27827.1 hypothetical protein GCM10007425_23040 [Lysinibacillus alkalisoli]